MTFKLQQCNVARAMDTPDDNTSRNGGNTRTELSMREAARFVRMDKGTLSRHQKSGRVTGRKDEQGRLWFEPSELMRAYPNVDYAVAGNVAERNDNTTLQHAPQQPQQDAQQPLIEELRERIEELKADKADLRKRLDERERVGRETENRLLSVIEKQAEQVKLLTDQRVQEPQSTTVSEPPKRRGLMTRLLGGMGRQ